MLGEVLETHAEHAHRAKDARQFTALHWAAYYGHLEVVRLLLAWKAPLEARNCYGGTPLGQTIWATMHQSVRPHHQAIIELLKEKEQARAKNRPGP